MKKYLILGAMFIFSSQAQTLFSGDIFEVNIKDGDTYVKNLHVDQTHPMQVYSEIGQACYNYPDEIKGDIILLNKHDEITYKVVDGAEICRSLSSDDRAGLIMNKKPQEIENALIQY